jgi:hypothetical protein
MNTTRNLDAAVSNWRFITGALRDPSVELDCETFAEVLSAFHRLRAAGATIDDGLAAIMDALARQLRDTAADADTDDDRTLDTDGKDEETPLATWRGRRTRDHALVSRLANIGGGRAARGRHVA